MKVINNMLFFCGDFTTINGQKAPCIAAWDGTNIYTPNPGFPHSTITDFVAYHQQYYFCGNLGDEPSDSIYCFARWDMPTGNVYRVGQGIKGLESSVQNLAVYKDKLYLSGWFSQQDGNAGNNLMTWNDTSYQSIGGLSSSITEGVKYQLMVYKGLLYTCGAFYWAGIWLSGIRIWDGNTWIPLGSNDLPPHIGVTCMAVFNNHLYIGGQFQFPCSNGTAYNIAEYTGNLPLSTGENLQEPISELNIYPNPTHNYLNISCKDNFTHTAEIYDLTGKLLLKKEIEKQAHLDISQLANGIYFISLKDKSGESVGTQEVCGGALKIC